MKKIIALLLAVLMVLSMVACASKTTDDTPADTTPADTTPADTTTEDTEKTDEPADTTTDAEPVETDGEYAVAMITDYGDITDQSFNQTTYEACKAFCEANGITFNYFKPAGDNTADRVAMIEKAVDEGYNVIVMPGYAFGGAIVEAAPEYKDVKFVALDVGKGDLLEAGVAAAGETYDYNPDADEQLPLRAVCPARDAAAGGQHAAVENAGLFRRGQPHLHSGTVVPGDRKALRHSLHRLLRSLRLKNPYPARHARDTFSMQWSCGYRRNCKNP